MASENTITLVIYLDLFFNRVPNFANDIVRLGHLADHKVMPRNPCRMKNLKKQNGKKFMEKKSRILGIHTRIIYDFFVVIQILY